MALIDNRYKPIGAPKAGGMGSVLRCEDTVLKRPVAIKFLSPGNDRSRIMDEIHALQAVHSPHVVQFYDIVIVPPDNRTGIVQEYVAGQDLAEVSSLGLVPADALAYLHQIATGLTDIHACGIIHRDVKPDNMKLDGEGIVKIYDFGLARDDDDRHAKTHGFRGTPGFAAPELYGSGLVKFTQAVDVYAFGCTAIRLRTGDLPNSLSQMPPAPTGAEFAGLGLHTEIESILERCLAISPADRPAMAVLRDVLRKHMLTGKHHALIAHKGSIYRLDSANVAITLKHSGASIRIAYDGFDFVVTSVSGPVFLNNIRLAAQGRLEGSCLITIGDGSDRLFVTFDVSHPEVVL